jgi:ferredoxin
MSVVFADAHKGEGMEKEIVRVLLDLTCCNGCGTCAEVCPEAFGFDDQAQLPFLKADPPAQPCVWKAAAYCPLDCIEVEEG